MTERFIPVPVVQEPEKFNDDGALLRVVPVDQAQEVLEVPTEPDLPGDHV